MSEQAEVGAMEKARFLGVFPIGATDTMNLPARWIGPAIGYYTRVLGFTLAEKSADSARLRRDEVVIGLKEGAGDPDQASCYFSVSDVEAIHNELTAAGIEPSSISNSKHEGRDYRVCFARDPYGVCFCFGQPT